MKLFIKKLIYWLKKIFTGNGVIVLMYHSIADNKEFFTVSPKEFEKQMQYLKDNNFNVISINTLISLIEKQDKFPPKTLVITFDDGYLDNYENALPILKKFNFPATIFIFTAGINKITTTKSGINLKMLSKEQIKELSDINLITIGCHSNKHIKLSQINNKEELEKELLISKNILTDITNKEITIFAYPYGDFNKQTIESVKKYFKLAFGIKNGKIKFNDNIFALKRNSIDSMVSFEEFKFISQVGKI